MNTSLGMGLGTHLSACRTFTIIIIIKSGPCHPTLWFSTLYEKIVLYALLAKEDEPGNSCRGREKEKGEKRVGESQRFWAGRDEFGPYFTDNEREGNLSSSLMQDTQPQRFVESWTRAPGVAVVKLQAKTITWKAGEEKHLVTKTVNNSGGTKFGDQYIK